MTPVPHVQMVDAVTREHAAKFAEEWYVRTVKDLFSEGTNEAFSRARLMTWPSDDDSDAQTRYDAIEREIIEATYAIAKPTIEAAFFMSATIILTRERGR